MFPLCSAATANLKPRREVERDEGMVKLVKDIQGSDPMASALLVECRGRTPEALEVRRIIRIELWQENGICFAGVVAMLMPNCMFMYEMAKSLESLGSAVLRF